MVDHISSLGSTPRLASKKEISMETMRKMEEIQSTDSLKETRLEIERAFALMSEVRSQLESAYRELSSK